MNASKKTRLQCKGYKVGVVEELLWLTGDARAIEAAEIIYDNYLTRLIREDR
jgi:hypothetical protein